MSFFLIDGSGLADDKRLPYMGTNGILLYLGSSSISIVAAFQAKFIFNVYSDFAVINYSPLKIRCFFGLAAMPRGGVEGSFCQKTESNGKLPAAGPLRLSPRQSKVYLPVP